MVRWQSRLALVVGLGLWSSIAEARQDFCGQELLPDLKKSAAERPISAVDLVRLRDFGDVDSSSSGEPAFSISPDKKSAALILRRADLTRDGYCYGVVVVSLAGGKPRLVDTGGERIPATSDIRGVPAIDSGAPDAPVPLWTPDGRWILYLRRDNGKTRLWRVGLDGKPATELSSLPSDALSVELAVSGTDALVTSRPSLDAGIRKIKDEGQFGYLFDRRFWTVSEAFPRPALPLPETIFAIDIGSGQQRLLDNVAAAKLRVPESGPISAILSARTENAVAWTAKADPSIQYAPDVLHVTFGSRELACPADICASRVSALWWADQARLIFLRGGKAVNGGRTEVYSWNVATDPVPQKLFETADTLIGCQFAGDRFLCAREAAAKPRSLVSIDLPTGTANIIFDPNPEFWSIRMGQVQRLRFADHDGNASYGDLVLPPKHVSGQKHPLVVVQYTSRGFLRGGAGDEYPIYLLAQNGFAVLSFQRPAGIPELTSIHDLKELQQHNIPGWRERRIIASVLLAGVDAAIATGSVEADNIGLTGMSDGGTTTQFLLLNSNRFKAAAVSSCCDDPSGLFVVGPAYRDFVLSTSYPPNDDPASKSFWSAMSLAQNAARMRTPLLIQEPDMEYRLSLEAVSALQLHGAPVEMYVFPDERHLKFHPAHRLAVYERSVAWFNFWLQNLPSQEPARKAEIQRWTEMRERISRGDQP